MAKFPIVLYSKEVMTVSRKVDYVLNGCQFMSFDVEASVVATTVDLSKRELVFEFDMDNWEPFVDQVNSVFWVFPCAGKHWKGGQYTFITCCGNSKDLGSLVAPFYSPNYLSRFWHVSSGHISG